MIPTSFDYKRADSVQDALEALDGNAKILAGGHSLLPSMKLRLYQVDTLVDISKIKDLQEINFSDGFVIIGAGATHSAIAESDIVKKHAPLFAMVASKIGDVQVRNVGTIGGSIVHADPAADWPAALLACDAIVTIRGKDGGKDVAAGDFFTGLYSTVLGENEIITAVKVPDKEGHYCHYEKFTQPASRFALVGCAVCLKLNDGQVSEGAVAFTGVSDTPYRDSGVEATLNGRQLTPETIHEAVEARDTSRYVMSDHFAGEEYRKHISGIMLKRALSQ